MREAPSGDSDLRGEGSREIPEKLERGEGMVEGGSMGGLTEGDAAAE